MRRINFFIEIPRGLAFSVMLALSFVVAMYTVKKGKEVADLAKEAPAFNIEKRMTTSDKK